MRQISNFCGNFNPTYKALNTAGNFSNSELKCAAKFEARLLDVAATRDSEISVFF